MRVVNQYFSYFIVSILCCWPLLAKATSIVDDRHQSINLTQPPKRIATISTFAADTVVSLGFLPIAVSNFGDKNTPSFLHPNMKEVPSLGLRAKTDLETLAKTQPDLIVAIRRYTEPNARKFEEIAPYIALNAVTYDDSLNAVSTLSKVLGVAEKGDQLNRDFETMVSEYREVIVSSGASKPLTAAMLVSSSEMPFAYYDHFFPVNLLIKLNVQNAIGASPAGIKGGLGYRLSLEQLLVLNPDVLFIFESNRQQAYMNNPIWPYLNAVKNNRVYRVGQHWKDGIGPISRRYILEEMAYLLYPDQFPEANLPNALRHHVSVD